MEPAESGWTRTHLNPADLTDRIGEFTESGGDDADRAVDAAAAALPVGTAIHAAAAHRLLRTSSNWAAGTP
ncbi:hypothetical protein [Streptomyces sclerotialus]|uniref:hypothetical protein n=1 Tax=Streptomyces sclerotialus TaxID=1957 RepID=UPI0004C8BA6E